MGQCDDFYTRIQELQAKKRRMEELQRYAFSMADSKPDPDRLFTYRDPRTGKETAVDFDDLWRQMMVDPATRDWAMKAAQKGQKPMGSALATSRTWASWSSAWALTMPSLLGPSCSA